MDDLAFVVLMVVLIGVAIIVSKYIDRIDHQRIREHVEHSGGKVLKITTQYLGGWRASRDRAYLVTYRTQHGKTITASCRTSMFRGVYWITDRPPGFNLRESQPEPITCLECGANIPARQTHCSKCGWNYQATEKINSQ